MAIISFWSNEKKETGKTSSVAAITTFLAIQRNFKILVLDTKHNDYSYQDFFWQEDKTLKLIQNGSTKTNIASGISGLSKAILSNKTSPEIVTNYTKIVFKDRLEILTDPQTPKEEYKIHKTIFKDIVKMASKYYDLVFVDIDTDLDEDITNSLLEISDLVVANLSQTMRQLNNYLNIKKDIFEQKSIIPILGKFDPESKYTEKNVSRYIKEKTYAIPYNTLFFEACGEGKVADYFIKYRKMNTKDKNSIFVEQVKNAAEAIVYKLQELQTRM